MRLSTAALTLFCAFTTAVPLASKHNIYLATCTRPRSCLLIICDDPDPITAAAFYASGASTAARPTDITTISDPAAAWEGVTRSGRLTTGKLTSAIDKGAKAVAKGEIAGSAKIGAEEYVCFKDGASKFTVQGWEDWSAQKLSCTADYWCASTS
ncbi:hypothetical protein DPSP01_013110 [Paraphaeosphaeria sporulosa]|uniref:Uncharacterized protein n=1 Tax=Paraphaeosphaeria sporulosa TaxID=1460663 RepID=A0A177CZJ2_9PLEO|nr:uncharacterized protein CC84DRAFT_1159701 [Paraphaeosphaeria sporulosa]OAG12377.1 hypothetical protein CC84DRAFT_1159701 [Paraphaeosphaeria sporulosa]